jgi:hypothetical protein
VFIIFSVHFCACSISYTYKYFTDFIDKEKNTMSILEMGKICHGWHIKMYDKAAGGENVLEGVGPRHLIAERHDLGGLTDHRSQRRSHQSQHPL